MIERKLSQCMFVIMILINENLRRFSEYWIVALSDIRKQYCDKIVYKPHNYKTREQLDVLPVKASSVYV